MPCAVRSDEKGSGAGAEHRRQAGEGRQVGSDFATFDLAQVRPRHSHAESDLRLGEAPQLSETENVARNAVAN